MSRRMLLKDAAKALGVSRHFLYTEARAGRIRISGQATGTSLI